VKVYTLNPSLWKQAVKDAIEAEERIAREDACEKCGTVITIGSFPFCPHGPANGVRLPDVTWPGGKTFENLAHEPQTFHSPAEFKRYLKANGIEQRVRHVPLQGGDTSPHTTRWGAIDLTDYADPAIILARQQAMADHCGLTLEAFLSISARRSPDPDSPQAPVIERYIRSIPSPLDGE
jgi:hypothetical protein